MADTIGRPAHSRRFIKIYLFGWAVLALGALGALAILALQAPPGTVPRQQVADQEPSQGMRALARMQDEVGKLRPEVGSLRNRLNEVQVDLGQIRDATAERDKAIDSRVTSIEERLATVEVTVPAKAKAPDKVSERSGSKQLEPRTSARVINVPSEAPAAPRAEGPPFPLETGSLPPTEPIIFGEAVVTASTPQATTFAVQLASGPSLPSLRKSWDQLVERHGALAVLQPRVVPPRQAGGSYRLLAGPLPSKADADRVCVDLGVGRNGCFTTAYIGQPL